MFTPGRPAPPSNKRALDRTDVKSTSSSSSSSVVIPASPLMKKLGWGTGVSVYCFPRSSKSTNAAVVDGGAVDSPTKTPSTKRFRSRLEALRSPAHLKSPWAVKKANKKAPPVVVERLKEEAEVLRNLQHPNIVGFRQVTTTSDGRLALAMEMGGDASLYDRIEERLEFTSASFSPLHVFRVGIFVSRALAYLHHDQRLLHGDIKSANILVRGHDFCHVKLCDFGVCQRLDENLEMMLTTTTSSTKEKKKRDVIVLDGSLMQEELEEEEEEEEDEEAEYVGTEPWCAKEVFDGGVISNKTDIFAFGLTLWEMWTLKVPHLKEPADEDDDDDDVEDDKDDDGVDEMEEGEVEMRRDENSTLGTRPPVPEDTLESADHAPLVDIFLVCSMEDSRKRPSAAALVKAFENIQTNFIETPQGSPLPAGR